MLLLPGPNSRQPHSFSQKYGYGHRLGSFLSLELVPRRSVWRAYRCCSLRVHTWSSTCLSRNPLQKFSSAISFGSATEAKRRKVSVWLWLLGEARRKGRKSRFCTGLFDSSVSRYLVETMKRQAMPWGGAFRPVWNVSRNAAQRAIFCRWDWTKRSLRQKWRSFAMFTIQCSHPKWHLHHCRQRYSSRL